MEPAVRAVGRAAGGYLLKLAAGEELVSAIHQVLPHADHGEGIVQRMAQATAPEVKQP